MLLHQTASKVEITEGFSSASFTIVDSQNSFALLQGRQYSDPAAATLRALIENALDAHTQADRQSKVQLMVNPHDVVVMDEGLGISPDDFQNHFTKFFASNRTHSNQYHGFFGVGAKAPLSVASQFNVRTVHEGMEYSWVCARGNPAPSATLVASKPAQGNAIGTRIQIERYHMDESFSEMQIWAARALELGGLMPSALDVHSNVALGYSEQPKPVVNPMLLVGGMPYPCPSADVLGLPEMYYDPLDVEWFVQEEVSVPSRNKKDFGTKKVRTKKMVNTKKTLQESLRIEFAIGDIELHFSKEKVALTASNITTIRTALEQQWLGMQWRAVQQLSKEKSPSLRWRLSTETAQKLRQQGHTAGLLAWACRPACLSGPAERLLDTSVALPIVQRAPEQRELTPSRWVATTSSTESIDAINSWANEWGIRLEWQQQSSKYDTLVRWQGQLLEQKIPHYTQTLASVSGDHPMVIACDSEWHGLAPELQEQMASWLAGTYEQDIYFTKLTMAQVHQEKPNAVDIKDYCAQYLQQKLQPIPEDALGMRSVVVHPQYRSISDWAQSMLNTNVIQVDVWNDDQAITLLNALHAWTGIPAPQYTSWSDWRDMQLQKFPLLSLLNDQLPAHLHQHIETLLNLP